MIYTTDDGFKYSHCILKDNNVTAIFYNNRTEEFMSSCLTEKEFINTIGYKLLVKNVNFVLTINLDEKEIKLAKDFKKRHIEYFI